MVPTDMARKLELPAVLFLYFTAGALATIAYLDPPNLGRFWQIIAYTAAAGLIIVPFTFDARTRAAVTALVTAAVASRIWALIYRQPDPPIVDPLAGGLIWASLAAGIVAIIARDHDRPHHDKLPR